MKEHVIVIPEGHSGCVFLTKNHNHCSNIYMQITTKLTMLCLLYQLNSVISTN